LEELFLKYSVRSSTSSEGIGISGWKHVMRTCDVALWKTPRPTEVVSC
jgi:hypothetical protein